VLPDCVEKELRSQESEVAGVAEWGTGLRECALTLDFAEKPFSDEKLGGALLAAPGGVRDASGSRKRLPSRANPASSDFSAESLLTPALDFPHTRRKLDDG